MTIAAPPMYPEVPSALGVARRVRSRLRMLHDGQDDQVIRVPTDAITEFVRELTATVQVSVHQIIPFPPHASATETYSDILWRDLAKRGLFVRRIYLLPPGDFELDLVRRRLEDDRADGVEVRCLPITEVFQEFGDTTPGNLWMTDEKTVVREVPTAIGESSWTVSERAEDLDWAYNLWDALWHRSISEPVDPDISDLKDPLVLSADWTAKIAPVSCTTGIVAREDCSWYHGAWQYLRMFGLVSNPTWHDEFYRSQLLAAIKRSLRENQYPELLISGCADYALLAYALRAVDSLHARNMVRIKVIDICPTPLLNCAWYAKRHDADVTLEEADILEPSEKMNGQFDVIIADAFLTRFSRADSERVVAAWARLLRPGGSVVTTVRLHPLDVPYIRSIEEEVSDFVTRARRRAVHWLWCLDARLDELTSSARRYALRIRSHNVGDLNEVRQLFTANGFCIEFSELQPVTGELRPTKYAQITAIKQKWT